MKMNRKLNICDLSIVFFLISIFFFNGTIIFYFATLIMSTILFLHLLKKKKFSITGYGYIIILFIVYNTIFLLLGQSVSSDRSLNRIVVLSLNFFVFIMISNYLSDNTHRYNFMKSYINVSLVFTLYLIILDWNNLFSARLGMDLYYPFGFNMRYNPNLIGFLLNVTLIFILINLNKSKSKISLFQIIYIVIFILLLGSRKSIVLTFGLLTLPYFLSNRSPRKKLRIVISSFILLIIIYLSVTQITVLYDVIGIRIQEFIIGFFNGGEFIDGSSYHRFEMIKNGIDLIKQKPMFGFGIDSYTVLSPYSVYAHNNYIELWVGTGAFGLFIFYSSYLWILIKLKSIKSKTPEKYFYMAYIILLFIMDFAIVSYVSRETIIPIYMSLAFVISLKRSEKK